MISIEMEICNNYRTQVEYTGGGIWIALKDMGETYMLIDSDSVWAGEDYECLSEFKWTMTDHNDWSEICYDEDMLWSKNLADLTEEQRAIYEEMKSELLHRLYEDEGAIGTSYEEWLSEFYQR